MKYLLLLCAGLLLVGCNTPRQPNQQKPKGLLRMEYQAPVSVMLETNGMQRLVTTMPDGSVRVYPE